MRITAGENIRADKDGTAGADISDIEDITVGKMLQLVKILQLVKT